MNAPSPSAPLSVFIIAAEESGDLLGAALARALAARHGGGLRLAGVAIVAGSTMVAEPAKVIAAADKAGIFVVAVREDTPR